MSPSRERAARVAAPGAVLLGPMGPQLVVVVDRYLVETRGGYESGLIEDVPGELPGGGVLKGRYTCVVATGRVASAYLDLETIRMPSWRLL